MVAISDLTLRRVTTMPFTRPTSPPNRIPASAPSHTLSVWLVTSMATTPAKASEAPTERSTSASDQQHRHARADDQHQCALAQNGDDVFDRIEPRRADRYRETQHREQNKQHDRTIRSQPRRSRHTCCRLEYLRHGGPAGCALETARHLHAFGGRRQAVDRVPFDGAGISGDGVVLLPAIGAHNRGAR